MARAVRNGKPASETSSRVTDAEDVARPRAPQREADAPRRQVVEEHAPVVRQVPAQPGQVVLPERGAGDEQVAVGRDPGHGHVALDPAAPVEELGVDDPPDRHVDVVRAHRLEERDRARPDDLDLGERRLVEQAGRPPRRQRLGADRGRPVLARPAARSERLVAGGGVRLEPVRALPAGLLAERRAEALEDRVGRRHPQRPAGLALLVRVVDVVVGRVVLDRARQRVALASIGRPEPPDVHLPEVELGLAIDDPRRHLAPDPARARDPVRREPGGDEEPADLGLAEDELVVRRERPRAR